MVWRLLKVYNEFIGLHALGELTDVDPKVLDDLVAIQLYMEDAVEKSGARILDTVSHKFEPMGVTVLMLLQESHASIHTYPDKGSAFFDIFTCGRSCDPEKAATRLAKLLCAQYSMEIFPRGQAQSDLIGENSGSSEAPN